MVPKGRAAPAEEESGSTMGKLASSSLWRPINSRSSRSSSGAIVEVSTL